MTLSTSDLGRSGTIVHEGHAGLLVSILAWCIPILGPGWKLCLVC